MVNYLLRTQMTLILEDLEDLNGQLHKKEVERWDLRYSSLSKSQAFEIT